MDAAIQTVGQELLKRGLNDVHKAFADYMLINPGCTLREMSACFKYSVSWICTVINSDMFKAYFEGRRQGIDVSIAEDLPARLRAAAHLATERIIEVIEKTEDADTIIDSFDKVLHRYGYAPNAKTGAQAPVIGQQNNVFYLSKEDHARAKEKLIGAHSEAPRQLEASLTPEEVLSGELLPPT